MTLITVFLFSLQAKAGGDYEVQEEFVHPYAIFAGVDVIQNTYESYVGLVYSFNRNLDKDGFMLRTMGSAGIFDYNNSGTPTDGKYLQGDIMLGYQVVRNATTLGIYIGADYQDYDLSPDDPTNQLRGSKTGFKAAVDYGFERYKVTPYHLAVRGSYSTAFDTYYALARVGHNLGDRVYGIEGMLLGDDSGDAQRIGGYALFDFDKEGKYPGTVSASAGYQFVDNADDPNGDNFGEEAAYFTLKFTMAIGR